MVGVPSLLHTCEPASVLMHSSQAWLFLRLCFSSQRLFHCQFSGVLVGVWGQLWGKEPLSVVFGDSQDSPSPHDLTEGRAGRGFAEGSTGRCPHAQGTDTAAGNGFSARAVFECTLSVCVRCINAVCVACATV